MFHMRFHALLDCLFSTDIQGKRRAKRDYFSKLAALPPEKWTVRMSECGPWFQTIDHNGDTIALELKFYGYCIDGAKVLVVVLTNSTYAASIMGRFTTDDTPFNLGPRGISSRSHCGYVDVLYRRLTRQLKRKIAEVERSGEVDLRNQDMTRNYRRWL